MKAQPVGYWIFTVLTGLSFLSGGAVDLLRAPQALEGMTHLVLAVLVVASWALRPEGRKLKRA
jgi:hypothetical protein